MNKIFEIRKKLKYKLKNRKKIFGGWISFDSPSIAETLSNVDFDFISIDMEHSTITLPQAQRIVAACQSQNICCLPRPVSHSNNFIKPLLESGSDGLIIQMVNNSKELETILNNFKYPPKGNRSFGINRAQGYGFDFDNYVNNWNDNSSLIIQIESKIAVDNIDSLLKYEEVDGVMIGPYDISGSYGVPGQVNHTKVIEASKKVILACKKFGKSCGTQIADPDKDNINSYFDMGYTFLILGSDLFALWKWSEKMKNLINSFNNK
tara:strand:+ start:434 stop:1225 length:792 start_codon:yes stop_codon:yes gene_type:complete